MGISQLNKIIGEYGRNVRIIDLAKEVYKISHGGIYPFEFEAETETPGKHKDKKEKKNSNSNSKTKTNDKESKTKNKESKTKNKENTETNSVIVGTKETCSSGNSKNHSKKPYIMVAVDGNFHACRFKYGGANIYVKMMSFVLMLLKNGIIPIFLFDGNVCDDKLCTVKQRYEKKKKDAAKMDNLVDELESSKNRLSETFSLNSNEKDEIEQKIRAMAEQIKLISRAQDITAKSDEINGIIGIMQRIGIPACRTPYDAESYATALNQKYPQLINAVMSDDTDVFPFGAKVVISKYDQRTGTVRLTDTEDMLKKMEFTKKQFVDMCILLGSDYLTDDNGNPLTIRSIGPKSAHSLMKQHGSIEAILKTVVPSNKRFIVPDKYPYPNARKIFLTCNGDLEHIAKKDITKYLKISSKMEYEDYYNLITFIIDAKRNTDVNSLPKENICVLVTNKNLFKKLEQCRYLVSIMSHM